jgi:hypothetical protein
MTIDIRMLHSGSNTTVPALASGRKKFRTFEVEAWNSKAVDKRYSVPVELKA